MITSKNKTKSVVAKSLSVSVFSRPGRKKMLQGTKGLSVPLGGGQVESLYSDFYLRVWRACEKIPKGRVATYGQLARRMGVPNAARAVGMALGANPFAPRVPCHRVVAVDGSLTGYSALGGLAAKRKLLESEGVLFVANKVDMGRCAMDW